MTAAVASNILDAARDHMNLHVGFCQWTRDDGVGECMPVYDPNLSKISTIQENSLHLIGHSGIIALGSNEERAESPRMLRQDLISSA